MGGDGRRSEANGPAFAAGGLAYVPLAGASATVGGASTTIRRTGGIALT